MIILLHKPGLEMVIWSAVLVVTSGERSCTSQSVVHLHSNLLIGCIKHTFVIFQISSPKLSPRAKDQKKSSELLHCIYLDSLQCTQENMP